MSLDPRIFERFQSEFQQSQQRGGFAQERVVELQAELNVYTAKVAEEQGIQQAINEALQALGEAPLS